MGLMDHQNGRVMFQFCKKDELCYNSSQNLTHNMELEYNFNAHRQHQNGQTFLNRVGRKTHKKELVRKL